MFALPKVWSRALIDECRLAPSVLHTTAGSKFISGVIYTRGPKSNFTVADRKHDGVLWLARGHLDEVILIETVNPAKSLGRCLASKAVLSVGTSVGCDSSFLYPNVVWALVSHVA